MPVKRVMVSFDSSGTLSIEFVCGVAHPSRDVPEAINITPPRDRLGRPGLPAITLPVHGNIQPQLIGGVPIQRRAAPCLFSLPRWASGRVRLIFHLVGLNVTLREPPAQAIGEPVGHVAFDALGLNSPVESALGPLSNSMRLNIDIGVRDYRFRHIANRLLAPLRGHQYLLQHRPSSLLG